MATFRRALTPGATYFFTLSTHERRPLLTRPAVYSALKDAIHVVKEIDPFRIEAFVLLPDHLHCIWTLPEGDTAYSQRWSRIKRLSSQRVRALLPGCTASQAARRELGLWQRRFWEHQIRNDGDFERHVDYIHWNPVKHGHVRSARDWLFSSFHRFVRRGVYTADWGIAEITRGEYGEPR